MLDPSRQVFRKEEKKVSCPFVIGVIINRYTLYLPSETFAWNRVLCIREECIV